MRYIDECVACDCDCLCGDRTDVADLRIGSAYRADCRGPKEPCVRLWSRSPRQGAILGDVRPTEKLWESLLRCMQQKGPQ